MHHADFAPLAHSMALSHSWTDILISRAHQLASDSNMSFAEALNMPIIAVNDAMKREFTKNIRYLGSVQDILSKHHALSTPFPKISSEIMQEIEDEFLQRSQQSS